MRLPALVLICLLAATAHAQATWKGLHFGQNRDSVRAALARQSFEVEVSQEGSLQSVSDYQLLLPGMRYALPLRADFHFTDDGGLINIMLWLDLPAMKQNFAHIGNEEALMLFAAGKLTRALTDKYAVPTDTGDDCDADSATLAKRAMSCAVNWRDPYQSVELNWTTRAPRLFVRYQMLAADL